MRKRICRDTAHGVLLGYQFFANHIDGDTNHGVAGALAISRLQNVETIFLHREFEVLHVFEVTFKDGADFHQFFVRCRHFFRQIANWMRRAHAGNDVFALRVDQVLAIENFFAGGRVARKGHSGGARFAHVSKDHRLHVHRRSPVVRDSIFPPINDGAIVHPRAENCAHCSPELLVRILGKRFSSALLDQRLKPDHEFFQIGGC